MGTGNLITLDSKFIMSYIIMFYTNIKRGNRADPAVHLIDMDGLYFKCKQKIISGSAKVATALNNLLHMEIILYIV